MGWSITGTEDPFDWRNRHAFLWYDGEMRDLGTLDGTLGYSEAVAVNSSGHVVGGSSGGSERHAFLWLPEPEFGLPAGMNDLDPQTVYGAFAWDINDRSEIAGNSDDKVFLWLPNPAFGREAGLNTLCVWDPPLKRDCPIGNAYGAINDVGQVTTEGKLWLPWPAYGRASGWSSIWFYVYGVGTYATKEISNSGLIVGNILAGLSGSRTYQNYWLGEDRVDRPSPESSVFVNGVNDRGDVVGGIWRESGSVGLLRRNAHANDEFLDLNIQLIYSEGWRVLWGSDINNVGQIAGAGHHEEFEYEFHPVLLQPIRPDINRSGRVDLDDLSLFSWCLDGPSIDPDYDCMVADLEGENDVDLKDFQALQVSFEAAE